jgi:replicative DNA helicase
MLELQEGDGRIDLRTLQARLEQQGKLDGVGGIAYLSASTSTCPTSAGSTPTSRSSRSARSGGG